MRVSKKSATIIAAIACAPLAAGQALSYSNVDWSGPYMGAAILYAAGWSEHYYDRAGHGTEDTDPDGFGVALYAGYNHDLGDGYVIGVEADFGMAAIEDETKVIFDDHYYTTDWGDYFGSIRARGGYAFDDTLVYATAGFGFMDSDEVVIGNTPQEGVSNEGVMTGFVGGLGVEHRLWQHASLRAEWLHFSFAEEDGVNIGRGGDDEAWTFDGSVDMFRVGITYEL